MTEQNHKKTISIEKRTDDPTIDLVLDTLRLNKQALVFANTKRSAEKTAEDISKKIKENRNEWEKLSLDALKALSKPTKQCERLSVCLKKGVAFHHAGLAHKQKEMIEDKFREGAIKIICCTPTLAWGLDLPAFRAIMKNLKRYGHRGLNWIPTLEYLQMAGRAGRPKFDDHGEAIAIVKDEIEKEEVTERYVKGESEEIYSKLAVEPVLRTYVLSLIATGFVSTEKEIIGFFSKTFWAHQYSDMEKLSSIIRRMLGLLEEYQFIESDEKQEEEFQSASDMFDYEYKPTQIGKRIAELYIDPLTANHIISAINKTKNKEKKINEFSFLQIVSHTLEIRPLLRVKTKEYDIIQEEVIRQEEHLLEDEPTIYDHDYDEYLNSIKTAMFLKDWINEKDEEYLLETYNIRPGEIKVKLDLADWLLYCTEELTRIMDQKELIKEIIKLRIRIKQGAKEELLPLLRLKKIGRVRARKLFNSGIKDIKDVKKASATDLAQIIGARTSVNIKEQLGQKIKEIPKGTRKGQMSITKFF